MADTEDLDLVEQAALGSGATFWTTKAVGPVRSMVLTDGPHGVRKQIDSSTEHLATGHSAAATCFPPAVGLSQTWDPDLVQRVGTALGWESRALGVDVLLGPGINIKRDPRCGRNFEYFSEDPVLSGALGAAWVRGVQGVGVAASLKHFAANNAEFDRMRASSDVDERTLREIYLRAFEHVVRTARPWSVMCSYNRINGIYAAQNRWLLTDVLRGEWGFDGLVVSDWGAVADRVAAVAAGLDLEMPGTGGASDRDVVEAVERGDLPRAAVAAAAGRVARLADRTRQSSGAPPSFDADAHHLLAREAAARAIVLLKNDGDLLPLRPSRIAVIGRFATQPRYQGGGSSHVNPTRLDTALDEIRRLAGDHEVTYTDDARLAAAADTAVVFLGLPAEAESEGFDRPHIDLPAEQIELLRQVVSLQPRTVVVLSHGGVVRLDEVAALAPAVLDGALLGQAGGGATADVLFGHVNPSGRLTETVPARLQDVPAYLNFPSERGHTIYGERIFVGYRWYDARDLAVTYPFGHGLSYTTFDYRGMEVAEHDDGLTVTVTVANTGNRRGREVVQIYAGMTASRVDRPTRWLVGFGSLTLDPGATGVVEIPVSRTDLAHWADRWVVESGEYTLWAAASSRDLRLRTTVPLTGDDAPEPFTRESTLGDVLADPVATPILTAAIAELSGGGTEPAGMLDLIGALPLERLAGFSGGRFTRDDLGALLIRMNAHRDS
ncbi:glycoside hydrolase family 3 C-terminal domain-containing protein [Mycolicibacterium cosmeticum]|uniref:glycoside hydrolase family 3 C-terminal domain-containing protein n=1 Tax=Mycolicibacterium cosmeticum TaxID=258533 RepID=UPI003204C66A